MRLLFKEAIQTCFNPPDERLKKLNAWVENSNSARETKDPNKKLNQYDKTEELITFYTFAPLVLSLDRVGLTNRILSLARLSAYEESVEEVALERQFTPPKEYFQWLRKQCGNHPIRYIRKQASL
jgi:hypothetical protein